MINGSLITHVDAPALTRPTGGIFDVATPISASGTKMLGVQYETEAGASADFASLDPDECYKLAEIEAVDGLDYEQGSPFFVHRAVQCRLVGANTADAEDRARRALELGEERLVEQKLWDEILPARAIDLTPASGSVKPAVAMGILLEYAGTHYAGIPTVHFGKRLGVLLDSDDLLNKDKARYVDGAGYVGLSGPLGVAPEPEDGEDPVPAAPIVAEDGDAWMYVSGTVTLWRDEIESSNTTAYASNEYFAVAHRTYIATVETFAAAIRVHIGEWN